MSLNSMDFFNVLVGLTSPYGLHGAKIKKKEGDNEETNLLLSAVSTILWVAELLLLILAFVISSNIESMNLGDYSNVYSAGTTLLFFRTIFVAIFVLLNVVAGFDRKIRIRYEVSVILSILEIGTSILPIISLGIMQDDLAKTEDVVTETNSTITNSTNSTIEALTKPCASGIPEGNAFDDDASVDLQLSTIHIFVLTSLFVRLIRNYSLTYLSNNTNIGFEVAKANMTEWQKRKLDYSKIRKNAKEEVTYNFSRSNGIIRHDLI